MLRCASSNLIRLNVLDMSNATVSLTAQGGITARNVQNMPGKQNKTLHLTVDANAKLI